MSRLATVLLLLDVARAFNSYSGLHDFEDAERYLETVGVPTGLPQLSVKYTLNNWGKVLRVEGSASEIKASDAAREPAISWKPENRGQHPDKFVLLMISPDAPYRVDASTAGPAGPYIHWFAVNCKDSATTCDSLVTYEAPKPHKDTGKHRYIFLLFKQNRAPSMDVITKHIRVHTRENWKLEEFLEDVGSAMEPVALNFFYGSASGAAGAVADANASDDVQETEEAAYNAAHAAPLKMKLPRDAASPPSAAPLGPRWTVRPKHDEL